MGIKVQVAVTIFYAACVHYLRKCWGTSNQGKPYKVLLSSVVDWQCLGLVIPLSSYS